jgi:hypothetical protein
MLGSVYSSVRSNFSSPYIYVSGCLDRLLLESE